MEGVSKWIGEKEDAESRQIARRKTQITITGFFKTIKLYILKSNNKFQKYGQRTVGPDDEFSTKPVRNKYQSYTNLLE